MRQVGAVAIALLLTLWAGLALAQNGSTTPVPYVYRLKIGNCTFDPTERRQTGFRVQGMAGIVTALHGVADCQTISAIADDGGIFTDLVIVAVDIDHDMALLASPDLADLLTDGLAVSTLSPTEIFTAPLRIVGYPLGLDKQDVDLIENVRDIEPLDQVIPDTEESTEFLKRKSPDIDIDVLNLQAHLLPGHSGAPVIDTAGQLVAIGDGGLRGGTVGRSWAIPWQSIKLESIAVVAVSQKLTELATKDIAALSFSSTYPGSLGNTGSATYVVQVIDANQMPIANAEVLLTHSTGYEIGMTDSKGFYTFHLPINISYVQSQIQVEAPGYPLYNRTLHNVLDKIGVEIVRLAAQRPTPTTNICEFAFFILDEATNQPVPDSKLYVTLGNRITTGTTDSNGFYESKLPCVDPQNASVRVRVDAEGYKQQSETIPLVGEVKEIMLVPVLPVEPAPLSTFTPTPSPAISSTMKASVDTVATPTLTVTAIPATTAQLIVEAPNINIRSGPGTIYERIGVAKKGEIFSVTGHNSEKNWWQICCIEGKQGWIRSDLAIVTNPNAVSLAENIPEPPSEWINPRDGARYLFVAAGEFIMGSNSEQIAKMLALCNTYRAGCLQDWFQDEKLQTIYLNGFWIMRTEVTNAMYAKCVDTGRCSAPNNSLWRNPVYANHPVVNINWFQAKTYAEWSGGRLPSEEEWEKAARGTNGNIFPWGNEWDPMNANFENSGHNSTVPVDGYEAGISPYGLLQMAGNVSEWTNSRYEPTKEDMVYRGGAFHNQPLNLRASEREDRNPSFTNRGLGFRVVRDALSN